VYRFLHFIAGIASIIGFEEMGSKARKLMNGLQEKEWSLDEVKRYVLEPMIIRAIITDILTKLPYERKVKYEIQTFKDGVSFIESDWHKDTSPCLVILDGMMPKMDGLEVLQWLRNKKESALC
jgi:CheY-like chemotaxis protein